MKDRAWWDRRLSRRRLLAGGASAAAATLLAACAGGDGGPTANETPAGGDEGPVKRGGIFRLPQGDPWPSMNPFLPGLSSLIQGLYLGYTVFDHLWFVPTDTGIRELFLATSVEQPDDLTIIAQMGEAVFHDKPPVNGRKVLAQDVKASFERFREVPPIGFSWLHHVLDHIEAPDDRTVIFRQKTPWGWVFTSSNAGSPISSSIMPQEILHDDGLLNRDAIGSGRWMLAGHDNGANVRLRKFPNWRQPGLPYLDGVDFRLITESAAEQAALLAQDVDAIILGFPTRLDAEAARDQSNGRIRLSSDLSRSYRTLMLTWKEPFLDERVRRGINLALDRQQLIDAMDFGDGQMSGPLPPAHKRYVLDDSGLEEYFRHDAGEARKLLEAASFPFDREIELKFANSEDSTQLAQIIEQQLRKVGIKLKLTGQDLIIWLPQTLAAGNFQMTCFTHLPYEDADLPLRFYMSAETGQLSFMGYKDGEVDRAILAASRELDEGRRVELTKEAQRVLIRKWAPMLNLYSPVAWNGAWDYVKGIVTGRGSIIFFNTKVWLDK